MNQRRVAGRWSEEGNSIMPRSEIVDRIGKFVDPFRVTKGKRFRLKDIDPGDTRGLKIEKGEATDLLRQGTEWLAEGVKDG